jgi:ATP-dependent Clp protease ATP-binding subunit ClpC
MFPKKSLILRKKIEDVKKKRKRCKSQKFEEAASLAIQKKIAGRTGKSKNDWEEESKHKRYPIDEEDIAEVVSMMTGIPVKRMVQAETEKLRRMERRYEGHGVGRMKPY